MLINVFNVVVVNFNEPIRLEEISPNVLLFPINGVYLRKVNSSFHENDRMET